MTAPAFGYVDIRNSRTGVFVRFRMQPNWFVNTFAVGFVGLGFAGLVMLVLQEIGGHRSLFPTLFLIAIMASLLSLILFYAVWSVVGEERVEADPTTFVHTAHFFGYEHRRVFRSRDISNLHIEERRVRRGIIRKIVFACEKRTVKFFTYISAADAAVALAAIEPALNPRQPQ